MTDQILTQEEVERHAHQMTTFPTRTAIDAICASHAAALARIAELEAAQRWIPVEERLPDSGKIVLVVTRTGSIRSSMFYSLSDHEFRVEKFRDRSAVQSWFTGGMAPTHWQPLPPFPETLLKETK